MPARALLPPVIILTLLLLGASAACGTSRGAAAEPAARPLTYVALGASDSVGVGAGQPESEGWVPLLHTRLPAGSRLLNLGVSGTLLRQALDQQLPVALDGDPDLVTVWLAVNDFNARVPLDRYRAELKALLGTLRERTRAVVLVGNIPDVARLPVYRQLDRRQVQSEVDRWNRAIAEVVAEHGAELVDLYAGWRELAEHPEYVGRDGFHPSSEGYRRLADVFGGVLTERTDLL